MYATIISIYKKEHIYCRRFFRCEEKNDLIFFSIYTYIYAYKYIYSIHLCAVSFVWSFVLKFCCCFQSARHQTNVKISLTLFFIFQFNCVSNRKIGKFNIFTSSMLLDYIFFVYVCMLPMTISTQKM